ncbi:MAG: ABC transporter permease [Oscillospiraceae bacterium]
MKNKWWAKLYLYAFFVFMYIPIVVLIVFSFNESKSNSVFTGFSLDWYRKLIHNEAILTALMNTIIIAVVSSVLATILGTSAAIGIRNLRRSAKAVVMNVTYIPVINPEIITGVSLMLLFSYFVDHFHFSFGFFSLILAHISFNVAYVIYSVMPKLRQMNPNLVEAAQDLGCSERQAFFKVVIPEIMPGIFSGFLMALTYSIDDFVVSYFTAGTQMETLPITIYSMTRRKVSPEINALSTIIFVTIALILILKNVLENRKLRRERQELITQRKLLAEARA